MKAARMDVISLSYGGKPVLTDVSFQVEKSEFFVMIGPNGAGKTSLVRILAGLLRPDRGRAEVMGKTVTDYSRRELSQAVALVPQAMPTEFPFTVAETVLMGRSPYLSLAGIEKKADYDIAEEAMHFTDIAHLADRRLDRLSGGELQRAIIARAICQQPDVILLDEPTASLDPSHQIRVMDLMEKLRCERGTTVVMISHDLNLASMYGDRLVLLKEGQVEKSGEPREVLTTTNLEATYGCRLLVDLNPMGNVPRVTPVPRKSRMDNSAGKEPNI